MTLGQRIQDGRTALGLSQEGLGERLGVSRQAVSKWEADAAVPDTDKLIALSKLFGVSLNELLQVEPPPAPEAPPAPVPRPWAGYRWLSVAAAVLLFLMTAAVIFEGFRLRALEAQIAALEEQISPTVLDPDKELIHALSYDYSLGDAEGEMKYALHLTPAQRPQGLEVTFLVSAGDPEAVRELPATRYGDEYTASGTLAGEDWAGDDAVTISVRLTDGKGGALQTDLVRFTHGRRNTFGPEDLWRPR